MLDRFLAGESSTQEAADIQSTLDRGGNREDIVGIIRNAVAFDRDDFRSSTEASLLKARARIREVPRPAARRYSTRVIASVLAIAAVLMILIARPLIPIGKNEDAARITTFQSPRGERRTYSLPDGSSMMLAPASTAKYTDGKLTRLIELNGEALFRVRHDSSRTFLVIAGNAKTVDVGTEFVVRAYSSDSTVDIAVSEGAVMVSAASDSSGGTKLTRGQVARVESSGAMKLRSDVDATAFTGWATGRLIFRDAPLSSIAAELSRWFNRDISIGDRALAQVHLSAVYDKPSLGGTLAALAATTGARIDKSGSTIVLTREKGQ
jgi:transmembrane sensor